MSDFDQILAQGRAVQLQMRAPVANAKHYSADGMVATDIRMIAGPVEVAKDEHGVVIQNVEQMMGEIPKSADEGGIASLGTRESIEFPIGEPQWGIQSIEGGALGMHYVKLRREKRLEQAGRRMCIR